MELFFQEKKQLHRLSLVVSQIRWFGFFIHPKVVQDTFWWTLPSRKFTYPTWGKGTSSFKYAKHQGDMLIPWEGIISTYWWCVNVSRFHCSLVCKEPHSQKGTYGCRMAGSGSDQCWSDQWGYFTYQSKWCILGINNPLILSIDPIFLQHHILIIPLALKDRVFSHPKNTSLSSDWFYQLIFFMTEKFRSLKNQRWLKRLNTLSQQNIPILDIAQPFETMKGAKWMF